MLECLVHSETEEVASLASKPLRMVRQYTCYRHSRLIIHLQLAERSRILLLSFVCLKLFVWRQRVFTPLLLNTSLQKVAKVITLPLSVYM